jgi:PKD repeat protein
MKKLFTQMTTIAITLVLISSAKAQIVNIPDANFKSYLVGNSSININLDAEIQVSEAQSYTGTINAVGLSITDLTGIEAFDSVTWVMVANNNISSVDLSNNLQMTHLYIENNLLTTLDVSNNIQLQLLSCANNDLTTLMLDSNVNIYTVDCQGNNITNLDMSDHPSLYMLYCQNNVLTSLDLSNCPGLTNVYCSNNLLPELNLDNDGALQHLECQYNQLVDLNVTDSWSLGWLDCSNNLLTCVDLNANFMLTNVYAMNNPNLTKVNLKNFYNTNILGLNFQNCPSLTCFQVDDAAYSSSFWTSEVDPGATFNVDCGQPTTVFDNTPAGCLTTPITFDQTSTNFDSFIWYFGDGDSSSVIQDPVHTYPYGGNFYVQLFVKNCYGTAYADTDVVIGNDIWGYIDHTGGPLTDGQVILLKYEPFYTSFDTVSIYTGFEVAGWYGFGFVTEGLYQVKVFPDTLINPTLIPTYSGNTANWESAVTINHGCFAADSMFITMLEITPGLTGPGALSGEIIEGAGFGRAQGDPIHGVDVKLGITASSTIVACTTTDTLGQYSFTNLPVGNYTIYAEIPGLLKDSSYHITIDSTNMIWTYLDYEVDSNSIDIIGNLGIGTTEDDEVKSFAVYPNPVKDQANILFSLKENADVLIEVYNIYGVKVQSIADTESGSGEQWFTFNPKLANLKPGIYFITLTTNGKSRTARVVVME